MKDKSDYYKPKQPFTIEVSPKINKKLAIAILNCFVAPPVDDGDYERPMYDFDAYEVEFNTASIMVSRMYGYLPMNFHIMKALGELFNTEELNVNSFSYSGCESCDWGSNYSHTIFIPEERLTAIVKQYA